MLSNIRYLAAFSLTFLIGGSESKAVSKADDVVDEARAIEELGEAEKVTESGYINTGATMDYITIITMENSNDLIAAFPSFGNYHK